MTDWINKSLVKGSLVLLIVFGIYSFLGFVFQSSMARLLSVADYGVLAALFYIPYILSTVAEAIQTVFVKRVSLEKDNGRLKNLMKRVARRMLFVFGVIFLIYLVISLPLSYIEETPFLLFAMTGFFIIILPLLSITRGIIQGRKKFYSLGANLIVEATVKVVLSIFFVIIGWKVYGALAGPLIGASLAFVVSFLSIRDVSKAKEKHSETLEIKKDSKYVFLITFSLLAFYITDIFIAQLVFNKETAGYYAIASILSKAIFWGTQPIGRAMFPISTDANLKNEKKDKENVYFNALTILILLIFVALLLFYFFPDVIVRIFAGRHINQPIQILFYLGLATSMLSIANLNILNKISKTQLKNKDIYYFFSFLIVGMILLFIFNDTLFEFSIAFLTGSALFLWGSIFLMDSSREK